MPKLNPVAKENPLPLPNYPMKHKSFDFPNNRKMYHKLFFCLFIYFLLLFSLLQFLFNVNILNNEQQKNSSYTHTHTAFEEEKLKSNQIVLPIQCCCCCCSAWLDCVLLRCIICCLFLEIVFKFFVFVEKRKRKRKTVWYRIFV